MSSLRGAIVRLAAERPELREALLPFLKQGGRFSLEVEAREQFKALVRFKEQQEQKLLDEGAAALKKAGYKVLDQAIYHHRDMTRYRWFLDASSPVAQELDVEFHLKEDVLRARNLLIAQEDRSEIIVTFWVKD